MRIQQSDFPLFQEKIWMLVAAKNVVAPPVGLEPKNARTKLPQTPFFCLKRPQNGLTIL